MVYLDLAMLSSETVDDRSEERKKKRCPSSLSVRKSMYFWSAIWYILSVIYTPDPGQRFFFNVQRKLPNVTSWVVVQDKHRIPVILDQQEGFLTYLRPYNSRGRQ